MTQMRIPQLRHQKRITNYSDLQFDFIKFRTINIRIKIKIRISW
jgi:hypothetical protein